MESVEDQKNKIQPGSTIEWDQRLSKIDIALQPIVNIHSGDVIGYESLLRNHAEAGFSTIADVFDTAFVENMLFYLEQQMRRKSIEKFCQLFNLHHRPVLSTRLFINMDNRTVTTADYIPGATDDILAEFGLGNENICLEISERHNLAYLGENIIPYMHRYRQEGYRIALDDFGSGYSGLQQLYLTDADYMKIDRFFIMDIDRDHKKRLFAARIIKLAHVLGLTAVAEGVETEQELMACREIGFDLAQGYLIQKPTVDLKELRFNYEPVAAMADKDRRLYESTSDRHLLLHYMDTTSPLPLVESGQYTPIQSVLDYFSRSALGYAPVTGIGGEPIGIIYEKDLKAYLYKHDKDRTAATKNETIRNFITKTSVCPLSTAVDDILGIFTLNKDVETILLTENSQYCGCLSAASLLNMLHEKDLRRSRDENPLTKLPGAYMVSEYLATALSTRSEAYSLCYLEFNHFKTFNKKYGFRQGDRAIQLFASKLKRLKNNYPCLIAQVKGDDFFLGFHEDDASLIEAEKLVEKIIKTFNSDVTALFDKEDRARGHFVYTDRAGSEQQCGLLGVSAVIIYLSPHGPILTIDEFNDLVAANKKYAKNAKNHVVVCKLDKAGSQPGIIN